MSNSDYRIRQNDVLIVTPNKLKANSGGVIKDPLQIFGLALSAAALLILIVM
jgi:polysaccharide export outer membrane protein